MRVSFPTRQEVRLVVWFGVFCGLLLAITLCWGIVHKVRQSDVIVGIAASSAQQVERLTQQLDDLQAQRDAQATADAQQRAELQRRNDLMHSQITAQQRQFRALLRYLQTLGIVLPSGVATPPTSGGSAPKAQGAPTPTTPAPSSSGQPSGQPSSSSPATPAPTGTTPQPTPAPSADTACHLAPSLCTLLGR